jgi:GT2 family glycosyltransferase
MPEGGRVPHGRVRPIVANLPHQPGGDEHPETAALGWMAEQLARAQLPPTPPTYAQLEKEIAQRRVAQDWGPDASSSPTNYWHWKHLWHVERQDHPERFPPDDLPTEGPLLSIVVPVYRPSYWYFEECVLSVLNQTYRNWELCLCDDGSDDSELTQMMQDFAARDPRVKALALSENGGISRATNRALEEAAGEFVVLLDHDDLLEPTALAEIAKVALSVSDSDVIYTDEDKLDGVDRPYQPHFKPEWDPDLLLAYPYLGHITAIRHDIVREIGGFRPEFDGSQDFDIMLRATERARRVVHIPKVLYHWRVVAGSAAGDPDAKPWAYDASRRALADAVERRGIDGEVDGGPFLGAYHVRRRIIGAPTVSIIIPFRDQAAMTVRCLESLGRSPGYPVAEVVLIDNGSVEPETRELRRRLEERPDTRVLDYPGAFNWAAINNLAAATCRTDMLLFLNNDIEASSEGWLHALVEQAQRVEVGAVGARLVYPDGKVQHAGVVLGMQGIATHLFNGLRGDWIGYMGWDRVIRSYSALTAACMLVRRSVFEEMGGFDAGYPVAFNDLDFCLRLGAAGYRLIYTPLAELIHFESVSRGQSGYSADFQLFLSRWWDLLRQDDPAYNPNLGRYAVWCSLRAPGENERWLEEIGRMVPTGAEASGPGGHHGADGGADAAGMDHDGALSGGP